MQTNYVWAHLADDDVPQRPHPADDCLSSAQARRYWRLSDAEKNSQSTVRAATFYGLE